MMLRDTPKIPCNSKWIWYLMLPSICWLVTLPNNAYAKTNTDIDKYKIYIHLKVISYKEYNCITTLWTRENTLWDSTAKNPKSSAYGIPQMLKMTETNPYLQMDLGYKYILHRYKSACNALKFHKAKGYY